MTAYGALVCTVSVGSLLVGTGASAGQSRDPPAIVVVADPLYTFEPGRVTVTVRHKPAVGNRRMTIEVESRDFFRSSSFPLDGDRERSLHDVVLKALPAGAYRIHVNIEGTAPSEGAGRFTVCQRESPIGDPLCDAAGTSAERPGHGR